MKTGRINILILGSYLVQLTWSQTSIIYPHTAILVEVTLEFFYYSKRKFTMVNRFCNVTGFSHFTIVNARLVCCVSSNGSRMKVKFTIVKPSEKAWFIARLSQLYLVTSCREF